MKLKTISGIILLLFILNFIFIPSAIAETKTEYVYEIYDIGENQYSQYTIYPDSSAVTYRIHLYWDSNYTIDVYLLTEENYYNYKNGHNFWGEYENYGHSGVIDETLLYPGFELTPYYVVFDNSNIGEVIPSSDEVNNVAHVTLYGELISDDWLEPDNNTNGNPNGNPNGNTDDYLYNSSGDNSNSWWVYVIIIIITIVILIPIIVLALYFGTKRKTPQPQRYPPPPPQHLSHQYSPPPPPPPPKRYDDNGKEE